MSKSEVYEVVSNRKVDLNSEGGGISVGSS